MGEHRSILKHRVEGFRIGDFHFHVDGNDEVFPALGALDDELAKEMKGEDNSQRPMDAERLYMGHPNYVSDL
ncbi:hypothetical protein DDZ13_03835 [Coraliomargarita sinensis]|uniref:Uncharacterized protein n=2 Tax=Coraliomargarita sinensis TaxID=2174842 RepID=A0A317ZLK1_9BACT|nr:hypothetical protein DDZ13_03835 [Coraliomargarita sinensis]